MPGLFLTDKPNDNCEYLPVCGRLNAPRVYRWIRKDYLEPYGTLYKYKVLISQSYGAGGTIGHPIPCSILGHPFVVGPGTGATDTYLAIGAFSSMEEATAAEKYCKTKFARALLGTLKVTMSCTRQVWRNVPLQDFTVRSDIDWTGSVADIDRQLYSKYNLSKEEIHFVETYIKEMN